jgi:hypothetical protein
MKFFDFENVLIFAHAITLQVFSGWIEIILTPVTWPIVVGIIRSNQSETVPFANRIETP